MITEHTLGPWRYEESTCTHGGYGKCSEGCLAAGIWAPPTINDTPTFIAEPMWIRDRNLIAAAPDLLEALEEYRRAFELLHEDGHVSDLPAWYFDKEIKADAAIAKARGEEITK